MKGKFNPIWRVAIALVMVLSFGLMAAPVAATPDVSNVWVDLDDYTATNSAKYSIYFTPGADLTAGTDTINLIFPSGTGAASATATVDPDGDLLTESAETATIAKSATRATVTTPVDLSAGVQVRLDISAVTNPADGEQTLDIYTSQELTKVSSDTYTIGATSVTNVEITDPGIAGATDVYVVDFDVDTDLGTPWGKVTVIFPPEVTLPASMLAADVSFDGNGSTYTPCTVAPVISGRSVTITVSEDVDSGSPAASLMFAAEAGIQNPTEATDTDAYVCKVYTTTDAGIVDDAGFDVTAAAIAKLVFVTLESTALTVPNLAANLVVQTQDQYGNPSNVSGAKIIAVSSTSGTGQFYDGTDWGVTTEDIADSASKTVGLQYKDSTAGSYTITADEAPSAGWASATWDITVEAAHSVSLYDENGVLIDDTYTDIQTAIGDAAPGDTIEVEPGTYVENLSIGVADLTVESTGGRDTTIIDASGGGHGILIEASDVTVEGFTVDGAPHEGIAIKYDTEGVTVKDNTVTDAGRSGICLSFDGNAPEKIVTGAEVSGNIIEDCAAGINLLGCAKDCIISDNTITGSGNESLDIHAGTETNSTQGNLITGNDIIDNQCMGIRLKFETAVVNLTDFDDNVIELNTISGNEGSGILIVVEDAVTPDITGLVIKRNDITGNADGIVIPVELDYDTFADDDIVTNLVIKYNDISGNTGYGIQNDSAPATGDGLDLNATLNYWGAVTGPGADDIGGDEVTITSPWLSKSESECVTASFPALTVDLSVGWNTLSAPAKLISTADTLDDLVPTGLSIAYRFDGGWVQTTTDVLNPCDAVYILMTSDQTVLLQVDGAITWVPSKDLAAGWNLIGLASLEDMVATNAVASVADSFAQVVSPSMNSAAWVVVTSETDQMLVGEGYWIFMKSEATLGGFTICPIAPQY